MKNIINKEHFCSLKTIVYQHLGLNSDFHEKDVIREHLENWSSSKHLSLIMEIESQFEIKFNIEEIVRLNSLDAIVNCLAFKINNLRGMD